MKTRVPRTSGFTLIELIVVLAIMGLLFSMAFAILISTIDFKNTAESVMAERKVVRAVMGLIARDLDYAFWPHSMPSFKGAQDRFDLISTRDSRPDKEGKVVEYSMVGYSVAAGEGDKVVIFRRHDPYEGQFKAEGTHWEELTDQLKEIRFAYVNGEGAVTEDWKDPKPPRAVEVTLSVEMRQRGNPESGTPPEAKLRTFRASFPVGSWRP